MMINNGNLQFISTVSPQVIYLDFDGADAVYCNRDLDLDFNVTVRDSGMTEAEKRYILSALTEKYRFDDLYFTIEPPTEIEEFSTVYIGETEDFDSFSIFAGLAETIDPDNRIRNDNAFVLTNHVKGAAAIVSVIEHEISHIVEGQEHSMVVNDLSDYALTITGSGTTRGLTLEYGKDIAFEKQTESVTINVPVGQEVTVSIKTVLASNVNCSSSTVWLLVNGKRQTKFTFTISETSTLVFTLTATIANPSIFSYYTKSDLTIETKYYTPVPKADLRPYCPNGWSAPLLITKDPQSSTHQSRFTTDDILYLKACYVNTGTLDSGAFNYTVKVDDRVWTGADPGLSVNLADSIAFQLGSLTPGQHTITILLDSNNTVSESNESNNVFSQTITVTDAALPDLCISEVQLPEEISDHHLFDIAFSVTNKGRKTASASTVQVFDGSVKIAEMALEALASGSSVRKVLTVQPGGLTAGVHDLRFVVDSENAVEEINETNNTRQEELTVSVAENLPEIPAQISYTLSGEDLVLSWNAASSLGQNGGYQLMLTTADGEQTAPVVVSGNSYSISEPDRYRSWQIRSFSSAQLYSDWSVCHEYHVYSGSNSSGSAFTFEADGEFESLAYSFDDFEHELCLINKYSSAVGCDTYGIPRGIVKLRSNVGYQWSSAEANWQVCWDKEAVVISIGGPTEVPRKFISQTNGKDDIFWANSNGVWEAGFAARHSGELNGWTGTGEEVLLAGKNKILDIFEGSSDIGTLVLTDDPNGDALFLEDIYSALGSQARLRQINWIQAGGGDDVIDLTSQLYDLSGSRMKIYGGNGNDTIWANAGNHILYGDAGDDYLAGGSGNDLIIGGSGNDTLHGGGGEDLFTFGPDWGNDVVTQTADGCVKIWIDDGSIDHWDAVDLIYRDGSNSVKIIGCAAEKISFEFGDEGGRRHYDTYANQGAFRSSCSELNIVPFAKSPY